MIDRIRTFIPAFILPSFELHLLIIPCRGCPDFAPASLAPTVDLGPDRDDAPLDISICEKEMLPVGRGGTSFFNQFTFIILGAILGRSPNLLLNDGPTELREALLWRDQGDYQVVNYSVVVIMIIIILIIIWVIVHYSGAARLSSK